MNKNTKLFGELEIGQKFTFILFGRGKETFTKSNNNEGKLVGLIEGCEFTYGFNYNDLCEQVLQKTSN